MSRCRRVRLLPVLVAGMVNQHLQGAAQGMQTVWTDHIGDFGFQSPIWVSAVWRAAPHGGEFQAHVAAAGWAGARSTTPKSLKRCADMCTACREMPKSRATSEMLPPPGGINKHPDIRRADMLIGSALAEGCDALVQLRTQEIDERSNVVAGYTGSCSDFINHG